MSSPRKPRKRRKEDNSSTANAPTNNIIVTSNKTTAARPAFPLVSVLWPARRSTSQWVTIPLILMIVGLFRWTAGFWGYSGFNVPPMFGDFEAQRHWMELTIHLPISQWYFYDLEYWGLDYPPLTAYHSWLFGQIGSFIRPAWFALVSSRGFEDQLSKVYMRATVLVSEYLSYIPAAIILNRTLASLRGVSKWESTIALVAILMQPSTILIDYAHFQYNTVMLGLVLASMASIMAGRHLWACVFFVASLCFKQMALYYAPAIAAYLLGICIAPRPNFLRLVAIAAITLLSFAGIFAPLILGSLYDAHRGISPTPDLETTPPPLLSSLPFAPNPKAIYYPAILQLTQSIHRMFPFARGIFEDKVANFWCALHTIHKLTPYPKPAIQQISLLITIVSILPASMMITSYPRRELLPWAMASSAWGFFLCSFQVHEKSVLLPLLPMTILLGGDGGLGHEMRAWIGWANMLGVWTMFPLLKRDELRVPYAVLSLLWAYLLGLPPTDWSLYLGRQPKSGGLKPATRVLHMGFYAAMLVWHGLEAFVKTPEGKPYLWVVLNVLIGAAGFGICYLWCTWQLILRSGILDEYFRFRRMVEAGEMKKKQ